METTRGVCLHLKSINSMTFAGKDVQVGGYPLLCLFNHSNTTWLHYFSLRLCLRLTKFVCFHHLFPCGYHCCLWKENGVMPSAEMGGALGSSHSLFT